MKNATMHAHVHVVFHKMCSSQDVNITWYIGIYTLQWNHAEPEKTTIYMHIYVCKSQLVFQGTWSCFYLLYVALASLIANNEIIGIVSYSYANYTYIS